MKNGQTVKGENLYIAVTFTVIYLAALLLADVNLTFVAAVLLIFAAAAMYAVLVRHRRCPADLGALLLLFWTLGLGLAILRLSRLHTPWTWQTKVSFGAFPVCYFLGEGLQKNRKSKHGAVKQAKRVFQQERLLWCIAAVSVISALTFVVEALYLGYIPIFSKDTHAYNYFHVTGLHYFTVSCMLTHALSAVALLDMRKRGQHPDRRQGVLLIVANVLSLSIAVMCISKLQFLLIIGLPLLILLGSIKINDFKALPWRNIIGTTVALLVLFAGVMVVFTYFRHYEPGYLNDIFEFRNPDTPVWIQYPYMYIANNFANFNCMTEQLTAHTYGLKQLFPVFALTGTKFIWPQLVNFPLYVVKEEINTLTIIYDAYYDFGIPGVMGFGLILGAVSSWITKKCAEEDNPVWMLFYAQIAMYMVLSFFSAWYSVATTWFWFAVTALICFAVKKRVPKEVGHHE
jgi:oligosaccharide repeat unit polymerase